MDFVQLFSPVETLDDFLNKTFAISVLYFEFLENYILVTFFLSHFLLFTFIYNLTEVWDIFQDEAGKTKPKQPL